MNKKIITSTEEIFDNLIDETTSKLCELNIDLIKLVLKEEYEKANEIKELKNNIIKDAATYLNFLKDDVTIEKIEEQFIKSDQIIYNHLLNKI